MLMIRNGKKFNVLSDGFLDSDIELLTFDTIMPDDTITVFKVSQVLTSRQIEGKYPNNQNPVITEFIAEKTDISYNDILNGQLK